MAESLWQGHFGSIVPTCIRVATENLVLDRGRSARYAQEQENTGFFSNVAMVLYVPGLVVEGTAPFQGSSEPSPDPSLVPRRPKLQDRRINPPRIVSKTGVDEGNGMSHEYSTSPDGERFPLPSEEDYEIEFQRLEKLAAVNRDKGREIVVVLGMGFVGAVMAAVVADSTDDAGNPAKFVIGVQRPSTRSFWKIGLIGRGLAPMKSEDPEVPIIIERCVKEKETLTASYTYKALTLADVVVVDVQCDYVKKSLNDVGTGYVQMEELEKAIEIIGELIRPEALVLIETTVPPGTTEQVAYPLIKKAFHKRGIESEPLIAHSYERVMPGANYVASIRNFWRVCSGINPASRERVVKFLQEVIDTKNYPLTVLDRPIESETAKIVENSSGPQF